MVDVQTMGLIVQTIGVVGTLSAAIIAVRSYVNSNRRAQESRDRELETRQAQLFMQIYQAAMSPELNEAEFVLHNIELKDLDDWNELLKDKEKYKAWMIYGSCLEGVGLLVRENLIDIGLPAQLMSGFVIWFWERYKLGILDCRSKLNWPRFMIEVEYLYNRVKDYGREHPELQIASPSFT